MLNFKKSERCSTLRSPIKIRAPLRSRSLPNIRLPLIFPLIELVRIFSFLCSFIRHTKSPYLAKTFKKRPIFREFKENKDCSLMINVSAAPLSLFCQKCECRSAHRSQLKIRAPLLQSLPACERSLRAERKRAPLINALESVAKIH